MGVQIQKFYWIFANVGQCHTPRGWLCFFISFFIHSVIATEDGNNRLYTIETHSKKQSPGSDRP